MSRRSRCRSEDPSRGLQRLLDEVWETHLDLMRRATYSQEERQPWLGQRERGRDRSPRRSRWDRSEPPSKRIKFTSSSTNIDFSACSRKVQHVTGMASTTSLASASGKSSHSRKATKTRRLRLFKKLKREKPKKGYEKPNAKGRNRKSQSHVAWSR